VVEQSAKEIGIERWGAHDLRRTCAKLCRRSGGDLEQIKWEFDSGGIMHHRYASINDLPIKEMDRLFHRPHGRRPDGHKG
jgi:nuclear transport factor 2 (NTF2) superfamily protein